MSISSNSVNYATPSYADLNQEVAQDTVKYFSLHDNKLDGSYKLLGSSHLLWSARLSDSSGVFSTPIVITIEEVQTVHALRVIGDYAAVVYPVAFTIQLLNGTTTLLTETVTNNAAVLWQKVLTAKYDITKMIITISKINKANYTLRLTDIFDPHIINRSDSLNVLNTQTASLSLQVPKSFVDTLVVTETDVISSLKNSMYKAESLSVLNTEALLHTNSFKPSDILTVTDTESNIVKNTLNVAVDSLSVISSESDTIQNTLHGISDVLEFDSIDEAPLVQNEMLKAETLDVLAEHKETPTNVHTRMSDPMRQIYGKMYVTYLNPLVDTVITATYSGIAYNSNVAQVSNGMIGPDEPHYFTLYDNDLTGTYILSGANVDTGWSSDALSLVDGTFATSVWFETSFVSRLLNGFKVIFDPGKNIIANDFTLTVTKDDASVVEWTVNDHDNYIYDYPGAIADVVSVRITFLKINKPGCPARITELPINSVVLYEQDALLSFDLLEELTYDDTIGTLGCVSANQITARISNENGEFFFNNEKSLIANQLKKNRRLEPWLGVDIEPAIREWHRLGVYWSTEWTVPVNSLYATVIGYDTIGLLNTITFFNHQVYFNKSLKELLQIIFTDAMIYFPELLYSISDDLGSIIVPVAWFAKASFMQALKLIAGCALVDIYCDRSGTVVCVPRRLEATTHYATLADDGSNISKSYPTFYTEVPNTIEVSINTVTQATQEVLNSSLAFTVSGSLSREFVYSAPLAGEPTINITSDVGITYTYESYSWGIKFNFSGNGTVSLISVTGNALTIAVNETAVSVNETLVTLNGENKCPIASNFIQTYDRAKFLADSILSIAAEEPYNANVNYRGDISLTLNDPVRLLNGIAPTDKYLIGRHTLAWTGDLSGTVTLNT